MIPTRVRYEVEVYPWGVWIEHHEYRVRVSMDKYAAILNMRQALRQNHGDAVSDAWYADALERLFAEGYSRTY